MCTLVVTAGYTAGSPPTDSPLFVTVTPSPSGESGSVSYSMDWGDFTFDSSLTHTYSGPGTYNAIISATDDAMCTDDYAFTITVSCGFTVTAGYTAGTPPTDSSLFVTVTPTPSGEYGSVSYSMDWGDGISDSSLTHTYTGPGTYNAIISATDTAMCTDDYAFTITVSCGFSITASYTAGTPPTDSPLFVTVTLTPTGEYGSVNHTIDWGDGSTPDNLLTHTYSSAGTYDVLISATDTSFCTDDYEFEITVICTLEVTATYSDDGGFSATITPSPTGEYGSVNYTVDWGDGSTPDNLLTHTYPGHGTYNVVITATDGTLCSDGYNLSVTVNCNCEIDVTLAPLGGTGCCIEVADGQAYSVGRQLVSYTVSDPCGCLETDGVLINGENPEPSGVCIEDGQVITVTISLKPECSSCTTVSPSCSSSSSFAFHPSRPPARLAMGRSGLELRLDRRAVLDKIRSSRRRPF